MSDDPFRRHHLAFQSAQEHADRARRTHPEYDAADGSRPPLDRSRWLGLQVRSLLAIVVVAEEGSFVAAARRLGYSRSTISHQIAQLEMAVGCSLIVRSSGSRTVTFTPAGRVVAAHGRAVFRLLANADNQLAELQLRERRRLVVPLGGWESDTPVAGT